MTSGRRGWMSRRMRSNSLSRMHRLLPCRLTASVCRDRLSRHQMSGIRSPAPCRTRAGSEQRPYRGRIYPQVKVYSITARRIDNYSYAAAMLLSGALFALFMTGFWLYCLTDVILTPAARVPGPVQAGLGRRGRGHLHRRRVRLAHRPAAGPRLGPGAHAARAGTRTAPMTRSTAEARAGPTRTTAAARHPAGRGRVTDPQAAPKGPDDDQEFLRALDQAIRRNPPVS